MVYDENPFRKGGTIKNDSVSSAPGTLEEPTYVEIIDTNPPPEFGPVEKQRHFGILRYTVANRFRKLMLIALVNLVVLVGFFLFIFFLVIHLEKKHEDIHISSTLHTYLDTTTTSAPTTQTNTTANPSDHTGCSPNQKSTFFFAYSNDFTADQVLNTWNTIPDDVKRAYETIVLGRFDLNEGFWTFVSSNCSGEIDGALLSGLPNSTESIKDPLEGSSVFSMINFFFNLDVTHCGATLFILVKRLPTDSFISDLVSMLQKYHAYVTFVVSNNSFGGSSSEPMYRLASETNGVCIFTEDDNIQETPFRLPSVWTLYLVYSFNVDVTSNGFTPLPIFSSPLVGYYHIFMTLQDHGPLDTFKMVYLRWYNAISLNSGSFEETVASHANSRNSTYTTGWHNLDAVLYDMTLQYQFLDLMLLGAGITDKSTVLERIYTQHVTFMDPEATIPPSCPILHITYRKSKTDKRQILQFSVNMLPKFLASFSPPPTRLHHSLVALSSNYRNSLFS
ncbi:hypothetical protein CRE_15641 [Caenorhabditis remanei]|uniref:DUF7154 domain-containing protein n=1 Tax=Caenorhabditis remanei TaxID=31234 RepID=E3N837_CAERE|nr:hypothetical protein CRE_15641 [Caenorhabditis remanei]